MAYELPSTTDEDLARVFAAGNAGEFLMLMQLRQAANHERQLALHERDVAAHERQADVLAEIAHYLNHLAGDIHHQTYSDQYIVPDP